MWNWNRENNIFVCVFSERPQSSVLLQGALQRRKSFILTVCTTFLLTCSFYLTGFHAWKESAVLFHTWLFWCVNKKNIFPLGFTWKNKFLLKKSPVIFNKLLLLFIYLLFYSCLKSSKNLFFYQYILTCVKPAGFTPGTITGGNIKWSQRLSWTFPTDGSPEK